MAPPNSQRYPEIVAGNYAFRNCGISTRYMDPAMHPCRVIGWDYQRGYGDCLPSIYVVPSEGHLPTFWMCYTDTPIHLTRGQTRVLATSRIPTFPWVFDRRIDARGEVCYYICAGEDPKTVISGEMSTDEHGCKLFCLEDKVEDNPNQLWILTRTS